jgi:carboxypeptidase Q
MRYARWATAFAAVVVGIAITPADPLSGQDAAPAKVAPATTSGDPAVALDEKMLGEARDKSELMKNLQHLSDVIGPRLTGSANLKRANDWAAEVMKSYGLSNVKLEPWEIPAGWERGTATMKLIDPDNGRYLTVAAAGWTPGTKGKIVSNVVVINAKTRADLQKYKGKLKNAVILRGEPQNVRPITDMTYGPGGGGGRKDAKKELEGKPEEKKEEKKDEKKDDKKDEKKDPEEKKKDVEPKKGGMNMMEFMAFRKELTAMLREEGAACLLSDSGKPHNLLTMTGQWQNEDRANAQEPIPSLFIAHEHYRLLHRLATRPEPATTKVELEITNTFVPGPVTVYNTVGEIPGEIADEFVVVGAHLDSWDLAQGTTDNGTGSCVVLEAARIIAKSGVKPKRTIRFVLFSGEEQGLFGSKAYVKRHKDEMPKTSVALVHDTGTGKVLGFGLQGREVIKPIMDKQLDSLKGTGFNGVSLRNMGGTDHLSFEAAGVPGFACDQDMDEYRLTHHTQSDTFDKAKEPNLIQGAQVMSITAMRVANLPTLLPRDLPKGRERKKENPEGKKDETPPKKKDDVSAEKLDVLPREVGAK